MPDIIKNAVTPNNGSADPQEEVRKELATRFQLLPQELQDVITSSDYQMKLFELAKKYKMTYEKLGTLELETTLVLLGMTHPRDFSNEVKDLLKIKDEDFANLMSDMDVQIFNPIKEALHSVYKEDNDEDTSTEKTTDSIMKKAGISVSMPLPKKTVDNETIDLDNLTQNDLLKSIENPSKSNGTFLNKVETEPVVQKIDSNINETMQDSISRLLKTNDSEIGKIIPIQDTQKKEEIKINTDIKTVLPDLPPIAPINAVNKQTTIPVKTIDTISAPAPTTPIVNTNTSVDPYRESI